MAIEIVPAYEIPFAEQARVANAAFAGYIGGWTALDASSLARFLLLQGADQFYSRFARKDGELVGFGYINRTGAILRLAAMAIVPAARGTGAAGDLLEHLLGEARARGDALMTLEVIQQNPRAVAFYQRQGFRQTDQLLGWRHEGATTRSTAAPAEIPFLEVWRVSAAEDYPVIPWPISRHANSKVEHTRAYGDRENAVVVAQVAPQRIRIYGLVSSAPDLGTLRALLEAVMNAHPGYEFIAPPVWPEKFGREVFAPLGFQRETLSQFYMQREP